MRANGERNFVDEHAWYATTYSSVRNNGKRRQRNPVQLKSFIKAVGGLGLLAALNSVWRWWLGDILPGNVMLAEPISLTTALILGGGALAGGALGGLGGYLGGKEKSYSKFSTLSPFQKPIAKRMTDYLQSRVGQPMEMYPGPMVSPYEQQGLNTLGQYLGGMGTYMPQRQSAYAQALGGQMLSPIDMSASRNWFEQNVVPQYQQQFQRMAAPALEQAKGMGAGVSSSAMNRAIAEQAGGMSQYLGDVGYQYMLQEQEAQRQREQLNAQYRMGAAGQMEPERAEQLGMVAASQQYGGLQFMREMQEWLRTRPEYSPIIQQALDFLNISMMGVAPQGSAMGGAAAGAGGMLGGIGSLMGGMGGLGGSGGIL